MIQLCQESVNPTERKPALFKDNGEPKNSSLFEQTHFSGRYWRPYLICKSYFLSGKLDEAVELLKKHEQVTPVKERYFLSCFFWISFVLTVHDCLVNCDVCLLNDATNSDVNTYQENFSSLSAIIRELLSLKVCFKISLVASLVLLLSSSGRNLVMCFYHI